MPLDLFVGPLGLWLTPGNITAVRTDRVMVTQDLPIADQLPHGRARGQDFARDF